MLALLQDLVRHKWHANASMLAAIQQHGPAACDEELRKLLHHILLADRFWFMLTLGQPFEFEKEAQVPETLAPIAAAYRETCADELKWITKASPADLDRRLESPYFKGQTFSVGEGFIQICMHSHGHRAQCSMRLRALGGTPPNLDFILWVRNRPAAQWGTPS